MTATSPAGPGSAGPGPAPAQAPAPPPPAGVRSALLSQPRGFATLFLTDMWERFSFYGLRAILFLYLVAPADQGGLGLPVGTAAAGFGLFMGLMFMATVPGGWLADRVLGARRAVLWGGVLIAAGHFAMMVPARACVWAGLALIIAGNGLLKPAMPVLVGGLYPGDSARRDAAFSLFFMSIQVSALLAPLIMGFVGERVDWHLGFGIAGIGMTFGVAQYVWGSRSFGDLGREPGRRLEPAERARTARRAALAAGGVALVLGADAAAGTLVLEHVLIGLGLLVVLVPIALFRALLRHPALTGAEQARVRAYGALFCGSACFWMLFDQAGTVLNLFAKESTDRDLLGFRVPASWFQSAQPVYILLLAPVFAWLFLRLGDRLGTTRKFAIGLGGIGLSFVVMFAAAVQAANGDLVSPLWLLSVYLLQVCGELALAPVGLSATAQIAPAAFASQMMGLWWLSAALGVVLGGQLARLADAAGPVYFLILAALGAVAAALFATMPTRLRGVLDAPATG